MYNFKKLRIVICCNDSGFELKNEIVDYLKDIGVESIVDSGTPTSASRDSLDYPQKMANEFFKYEFDFGISIRDSGNDISMILNRHQGIRAALCWKKEIAILARQHNNANVVILPAQFVTTEDALEIVDAFLTTQFEGGSHLPELNKDCNDKRND